MIKKQHDLLYVENKIGYLFITPLCYVMLISFYLMFHEKQYVLAFYDTNESIENKNRLVVNFQLNNSINTQIYLIKTLYFSQKR